MEQTEELTEKKDDHCPVDTTPFNSIGLRSVTLSPSSPSPHITHSHSNSPPPEPHFLLCDEAGTLSSPQNATPGNTSAQQHTAHEEDQPSFSEMAKAANIMLDIHEDMVRTSYKKIFREVYKRNLLGRLDKRKINVMDRLEIRRKGTTKFSYRIILKRQVSG